MKDLRKQKSFLVIEDLKNQITYNMKYPHYIKFKKSFKGLFDIKSKDYE